MKRRTYHASCRAERSHGAFACHFGYVMESVKIMIEDIVDNLRENLDIKRILHGDRLGWEEKSYCDIKHYKDKKHLPQTSRHELSIDC